MSHTTFTTTGRGLGRDLLPMRLYEKAKRLGVWNPSDIDFSKDQEDWRALDADERDLILRLSAMFQAGEEAVTLDLLPLIMIIAEEGRDESRHIAYGIFLLSRLMAAEPALWEVVEQTMNELFLPALGVIGDAFAQYDPVPFGLKEEEFVEYATGQFQKRIERIERARGASMEEIYRVAAAALG